MLRVLVLHGHGMSASLMNSKLGFLRNETKKLVEWTFVDGPIVLTPEQVAASMAHRTPAAEATKDNAPQRQAAEKVTAGTEALSSPNTPPAAVFSWYDFVERRDDGTTRYRGVEDAMAAVDRACRENGPFDGVVAFSQGCVVAADWIARQHLRALGLPLPNGAEVVPQPERLLAFGVFCSGLLPSDPAHRNVVLSVPRPAAPLTTVHCYGEADAIITPSMSEALRAAPLFTEAPAVASPPITHPGGHVMPGAYRKPLKAFFQSIAASKQ